MARARVWGLEPVSGFGLWQVGRIWSLGPRAFRVQGTVHIDTFDWLLKHPKQAA